MEKEVSICMWQEMVRVTGLVSGVGEQNLSEEGRVYKTMVRMQRFH